MIPLDDPPQDQDGDPEGGGPRDCEEAEDPGAPRGGILARLRDAGLAPRRALGQHFLHDPKLLETLVEAAHLDADDFVFEVGTGPGTLTAHLASRARSVFTVEIDPRLAEFARRELARFGNVEIFQGDVLAAKSRLHSAVDQKLRDQGAFKWISNLPYSVATPLLVTLLEAGLGWQIGVLTVQKELAERLCARPGGPAYGALTLLVEYWARASVVRHIGRGSFWPRPQVDSTVILLEPRDTPLGVARYEAYRGWVQHLFSARRKQIRTLLRKRIGDAGTEAALAAGGWKADLRPEALGIADILLLAEKFPLISD